MGPICSREEAKAKDEASAASEPAKSEVVENTTEVQADLQRVEEQIRTKDEIIKELSRQIERSRQIDIEIEKKQRGLLY